MDLYPWIVFLHAAAVLAFFIMHGVSMAVAFQLKAERDPDRVRALLDLSQGALIPSFVAIVIGLLAGIAAGFMGDWWGQLWIWISLGLLLLVGFAMTPMAASRLRAIRVAAGQPPPGRNTEPAPTADPAEMSRLLAGWNPVPSAVIGLLAFFTILWLMLIKPF